MSSLLKEYDSKVDSKHRITIRSKKYQYYHIAEYADGRIVMEPRVLTEPFRVSENTLKMMDISVKNLKNGKVSKGLNSSKFKNE